VVSKRYIPTGGRAIPGTAAQGTRAATSTGGILKQEAPVSGTGGDQGTIRANLALRVRTRHPVARGAPVRLRPSPGGGFAVPASGYLTNRQGVCFNCGMTQTETPAGHTESCFGLAKCYAEENWTDAHECDPYELSLFDGSFELAQDEIAVEAVDLLVTGTMSCYCAADEAERVERAAAAAKVQARADRYAAQARERGLSVEVGPGGRGAVEVLVRDCRVANSWLQILVSPGLGTGANHRPRVYATRYYGAWAGKPVRVPVRHVTTYLNSLAI
jgi:hypothetical protein